MASKGDRVASRIGSLALQGEWEQRSANQPVITLGGAEKLLITGVALVALQGKSSGLWQLVRWFIADCHWFLSPISAITCLAWPIIGPALDSVRYHDASVCSMLQGHTNTFPNLAQENYPSRTRPRANTQICSFPIPNHTLMMRQLLFTLVPECLCMGFLFCSAGLLISTAHVRLRSGSDGIGAATLRIGPLHSQIVQP